MRQQPVIEGDPPPLASNEVAFFSDFGPELCRTWHIGLGRGNRGNEAPVASTPKRTEGWEYTPGMTPSGQGAAVAQMPLPPAYPPSLEDGNEAGFYGSGADDLNMFADPLALTEGSWLFQNFEYPGHFG